MKRDSFFSFTSFLNTLLAVGENNKTTKTQNPEREVIRVIWWSLLVWCVYRTTRVIRMRAANKKGIEKPGHRAVMLHGVWWKFGARRMQKKPTMRAPIATQRTNNAYCTAASATTTAHIRLRSTLRRRVIKKKRRKNAAAGSQRGWCPSFERIITKYSDKDFIYNVLLYNTFERNAIGDFKI